MLTFLVSLFTLFTAPTGLAGAMAYQRGWRRRTTHEKSRRVAPAAFCVRQWLTGQPAFSARTVSPFSLTSAKPPSTRMISGDWFDAVL